MLMLLQCRINRTSCCQAPEGILFIKVRQQQTNRVGMAFWQVLCKFEGSHSVHIRLAEAVLAQNFVLRLPPWRSCLPFWANLSKLVWKGIAALSHRDLAVKLQTCGHIIYLYIIFIFINILIYICTRYHIWFYEIFVWMHLETNYLFFITDEDSTAVSEKASPSQ